VESVETLAVSWILDVGYQRGVADATPVMLCARRNVRHADATVAVTAVIAVIAVIATIGHASARGHARTP
jgi:hypothetical protein